MVVDILNKQDKEEAEKQFVDEFFNHKITFYRRSYYVMFAAQFICGIGLAYFALYNYYKEEYLSLAFNTFMVLWCFYWMFKVNSELKKLKVMNTEYKSLSNNNV